MVERSTMNYNKSTHNADLLETVAKGEKKRWAEKNAGHPMNELPQTHIEPGHAIKQCAPSKQQQGGQNCRLLPPTGASERRGG